MAFVTIKIPVGGLSTWNTSPVNNDGIRLPEQMALAGLGEAMAGAETVAPVDTFLDTSTDAVAGLTLIASVKTGNDAHWLYEGHNLAIGPAGGRNRAKNSGLRALGDGTGATKEGTEATQRRRLGPAAGLLRAIGQSQATLMITRRCQLTCADCCSPRHAQPADMDPAMARAVLDDLRGLKQINFSGGEPFLHRDIYDLIRYASERFKMVWIVTSGIYMPRDEDAAERFIRRFPQNTGFILSADQYHRAAIAKLRPPRNLDGIIERHRYLCKKWGLRLEVNTRTVAPRDFRTMEGTATNVFGPSPSYPGSPSAQIGDLTIHQDAVIAQGEARLLEDDGGPYRPRPLELSDLLEHYNRLDDLGLFITPSGHVFPCNHSAYFPVVPAGFALGNVGQKTLAEIIREQLMNPVVTGAFSDDELAALVSDPETDTNWALDLPPQDNYHLIQDAFGEGQFGAAMETAARSLAHALLNRGYDFRYRDRAALSDIDRGLQHFPLIRWVTKQGELRHEFLWDIDPYHHFLPCSPEQGSNFVQIFMEQFPGLEKRFLRDHFVTPFLAVLAPRLNQPDSRDAWENLRKRFLLGMREYLEKTFV